MSTLGEQLDTTAGAGLGRDEAGPERLGEKLIHLEDIVVRFKGSRSLRDWQRKDIVAVDHVDLTLNRGETVGMVGRTGCGKSTLAKVIMGMVRPTSGRAVVGGFDLSEVHGRDIVDLRHMRQIVLQDPYSSLDPRMRVKDIIAEPMTLGRKKAAKSRSSVDKDVKELMDLVGLPPSKVDQYPLQFSGGQRQRIAIARALAPDPEVIVLDEPTSALDVSIRAQILQLLKRLQKEKGISYIVISHDLVTVAYLASKIAVMYDGRIVNLEPTSSMYHAPHHPYTLELLASMPSADGDFVKHVVDEDAVDESLPEQACRYAARCALRMYLDYPELCVTAEPPLRELGPGISAACHFPEEVARRANAQADARDEANSAESTSAHDA